MGSPQDCLSLPITIAKLRAITATYNTIIAHTLTAVMPIVFLIS